MASPLLPINTSLPNLGGSGGVAPDILARVERSLQAQSAQVPKINAALNSDRTKLSGLGQLQSALAGFDDVVKSLKGAGLNTSAASSSKVATATSSADAAAGNYAVQVTQLAQSQVLQSRAVKSKDQALAESPTSIKLELGTSSNSNFVTKANSAKTIVVDANNSSLSGIASAINDAKLGVTAKVSQSGENYALVLTTPTGTSNTLRISVNGDGNLQKLLGYNPAGAKNLSETASAQNAQLKVNGKDISSQSNTVKDAIEGVSLRLQAKGSSEIAVKRDDSQVFKNIQNLVSSFNTLNSKLRGLQQGELKNNRTPGLTQEQLTRTLRNVSTTASDGSTLSLEKVGISIQRNGDLALDEQKLQTALVNDPAAVSKLFTNQSSGLTEALQGQIKSLTGTGGSINREEQNVSKDIAVLSQKKDALAKALTIQANALLRQYTAQSGQGDTGKPGSIFDFLG